MPLKLEYGDHPCGTINNKSAKINEKVIKNLKKINYFIFKNLILNRNNFFRIRIIIA
jgi:hypothetical protein